MAETYVALLYSIVLGPGRRVVMSELRALATELGYAAPRTLVATGNLVFEADPAPLAAMEERLEAGFAARFGRHVDIIMRRAEDWRRLAASNPFAAPAAADGARVHVRVMRQPADEAELARLTRYATADERLALVDGDIWIHFAGAPPSETRLLGPLSARRGGIGTIRNWNTVARIAALLGG